MYDTQINELRKIFSLLTDFLLRYRVVAPAGGSSSLRAVIQELLENLVGGTIESTMNAIYFELSNSTTLAGRYPDDEEFRKSLMINVNTSYARVLLLKIEEYETQNIPVEIGEVTIEHLMPQNLSDWWKTYLGGASEAEQIYSEYLNCIGNLTPVSRGYNSTMSNKPWNEKLASLKNVQFAITSEIANNYLEWGKADIENRNGSMANRAVLAVKGPLSRTRPIRTKSIEDYSPGKYTMTDTSSPMNSSTPVAIYNRGNAVPCSHWRELLVVLSIELISINEQKFRGIVADNIIHKATSKKNYPNKDPIFSTNIEHLNEPMAIGNSTYHCEGNISSMRARVYAKQLLELFECADDFEIEIT
jgi:hypothetical protein